MNMKNRDTVLIDMEQVTSKWWMKLFAMYQEGKSKEEVAKELNRQFTTAQELADISEADNGK